MKMTYLLDSFPDLDFLLGTLTLCVTVVEFNEGFATVVLETRLVTGSISCFTMTSFIDWQLSDEFEDSILKFVSLSVLYMQFSSFTLTSSMLVLESSLTYFVPSVVFKFEKFCVVMMFSLCTQSLSLFHDTAEFLGFAGSCKWSSGYDTT